MTNGSRLVKRAMLPPRRPTDIWGRAAGVRVATCARQACDVRQHVGERHVLSAENVAFADAAMLECSKMARGDVVDMHEVEASIDESRHPAGSCLDDDPPGWRWAPSRGPTGRGRVDDDSRQEVVDHFSDEPLGGNFAALISPDRLCLIEEQALVRRRSVLARLEVATLEV